MIAALAPAALGLLALAGLPLLVHWLTRRQAQRRSFPALAFLALADAGRQRRRRIRELLVLALRCTALACAAATVAGLLWRGGFAASSRPAVLVLDASCSMRQAPGGTSAWSRARGHASALLERLAPRPVALVLARAGAPRSGEPGPAGSALALLGEAQPGEDDGDPSGAIAAAAAMLATGGDILYITDLARGCLSGVDPAALPPGVALTLVDAGGGAPNLAITQLAAEPGVAIAGRELTLLARVANYGPAPARARVRLRSGQASVLHEVELPPGASQPLALRFTPEAVGTLAISADLVAEPAFNALAEDDRRGGCLAVQEAFTALVAGDCDRDDPQGPVRPLVSALEAAGFRCKAVDAVGAAQELASGRCTLVASAGVRETAALAGAIGQHLAAGGAWLQTIAGDGDAALADAIASQAPPMALAGRVDVSEQERGSTGLRSARLDHPLLAPFAGRPALLQSLKAFRYRLSPNGQAADATPLLSYADGTLVLAERRAGAGRWLLWNGSAAAIDGTWSASEALPLIASRLGTWLVPGSSGDLALPAGGLAESGWAWDAELSGGIGSAPAMAADGRVRLDRSGWYRRKAEILATAVPSLESDLRPIDPDRVGVRASSAAQALGQAGSLPLWPWLLAAALACLAAELALAGGVRRGTTPGSRPGART